MAARFFLQNNNVLNSSFSVSLYLANSSISYYIINPDFVNSYRDTNEWPTLPRQLYMHAWQEIYVYGTSVGKGLNYSPFTLAGSILSRAFPVWVSPFVKRVTSQRSVKRRWFPPGTPVFRESGQGGLG